MVSSYAQRYCKKYKRASWKMFAVDAPFIPYTPLFGISPNHNMSLKVKSITCLFKDKDIARPRTRATAGKSWTLSPKNSYLSTNFST